MYRTCFMLILGVYMLITTSSARPQNAELEKQYLLELPEEIEPVEDENHKNELREKIHVDNTRDIQKRIDEINNSLKRPPPKEYYYKSADSVNSNVHFDQLMFTQFLENFFANDQKQKNKREDASRAMKYPLFPLIAANPYSLMNCPNMEQIEDSNIDSEDVPLLKQGPTLPVKWPFAYLFPILIKDPFLAYLHQGGLSNVVEYGQSADVCNTKLTKQSGELNEQNDDTQDFGLFNRLGRKLINLESLMKPKPHKSKSTKKKSKVTATTELPETAADGDLKFPFLNNDFGFFGQKKPVVPSPGFFINRLKVRRGGVAIAGPGGVATAGRGGTAIVGPGGLAYTQPGGLAIAGPNARVVAVAADANLNDLVDAIHSKPEENQSDEVSEERRRKFRNFGKVVATGPVVYYHKQSKK